MTRPKIAALLRALADDFAADAWSEDGTAALAWLATMAHLDTDQEITFKANVLCWGDGHGEEP